MCMCFCVGAVWVEERGGLRIMSGAVSITLPPYWLSKVPQSSPELADVTGLTSQLTLGSVLCHLRLDLQADYPAHLAFRWVLRFKLQSLCLHSKWFNREPSPQTLLAYASFRSESFFQSCFMIGIFHQSVGFSDPLHFILEQGFHPKCSPS